MDDTRLLDCEDMTVPGYLLSAGICGEGGERETIIRIANASWHPWRLVDHVPGRHGSRLSPGGRENCLTTSSTRVFLDRVSGLRIHLQPSPHAETLRDGLSDSLRLSRVTRLREISQFSADARANGGPWTIRASKPGGYYRPWIPATRSSRARPGAGINGDWVR